MMSRLKSVVPEESRRAAISLLLWTPLNCQVHKDLHQNQKVHKFDTKRVPVLVVQSECLS